MLTWADMPTLKNAMTKRLDKERGLKVIDIFTGRGQDCIRVGVLLALDGLLQIRSAFELPPEFDYKHLHNEIDQIAEQCKEARRDYWSRARPERVDNVLLTGTGARGLWVRHA